ncbi:uncharacterized protein LOC135840330 [Planococcus citri]|uniref:uncharacterized protein LOC135840330 n=1 Tax=Planococcus citri TaxID=170843 RepID=UPI0031F7B7C0
MHRLIIFITLMFCSSVLNTELKHDSPDNSDVPGYIKMYEGKSLTLVCASDGVKPARWRFQRPVPDVSDIIMKKKVIGREDRSTSTINILSLDSSHTGTYFCEVKTVETNDTWKMAVSYNVVVDSIQGPQLSPWIDWRAKIFILTLIVFAILLIMYKKMEKCFSKRRRENIPPVQIRGQMDSSNTNNRNNIIQAQANDVLERLIRAAPETVV